MASYFDDFLDMGDTQPIKVDDLPDAFASLPTIGNLPPDVVGNTLTSVLAQPQMSPEEAQRQADDRRMVEGIQGLAEVLPINDPLNIRSPLSGYPQGMNPDLRAVDDLFESLGQVRTAGPFEKELKEVRKATEKAAKDFEKFQQSQNVADAAIDRANFAFRTEDPNAFLPPSYGQVDSFGRGGTQGRTFEFADTGPEYTFGISDTLPVGGAKRVGAPEISSFVGNVADTISRIGVPTTSTGKFSGIPTSFSLNPGFSFDPTAVSPTVDASILQGGGGLTAQQISDAAMAEALRSAEASVAQNALAQSGYLGGEMQFAPMATNVPPITRPSYLDYDPTRVSRTVDDSLTYQGTPITDTTAPPPITEKDVDKFQPVDDDTGAEGIVQNGGVAEDDASTTSFPPRSQSRRGQYFTSGTSVYVYHPFYQDNNGYKYVGETAYTDSDGVQQPSTVNNNDVNADLRRADSNLQDAIANNEMDALGNKLFSTQQPSPDASSAQPSAPGATSQFPIAPSFQPTINQFGQPVVQATGQPMQEVMRAPATYGEVLGGTPMQPMTTTGGFYDDLYQQSLEPVDAFKAYQLSQFPGASLGSRLAAQDALGTGFEPAFGRFLLGSASGRIAPTDIADASGGFGGYLRDRQRADLSQVRQEFANLGAALRGYTPGGALDPRFASYYETFGDPSKPESLRNSILNAAQAALGTRRRTGALGNIYDVMQQQYGAGAGSRFADFVSGAFAQRPMVQPMQSFAPTTSNFLAQSQSNPYYGVSSTSAMARQQPVVTPEPTLFGGTMGY